MSRVVLATLMGGSCLAMAAVPAHAETELALSLDGVTWTDAIDMPLFPAATWVPGDARSATFFVRNSGGSHGDLAIDVTSAGAPDLVDDLRLSAQGGGGTWRSVSGGGTQRVLTAPRIPDGAVEEIVVTVAFKQGSPSSTQRESAHLTWLVSLTESVPGQPGGPDGPEPPQPPGGVAPGADALPDTGSVIPRWMFAAAAVSVGAGIAQLSRRSSQAEAT